jgi:hypothetical protein
MLFDIKPDFPLILQQNNLSSKQIRVKHEPNYLIFFFQHRDTKHTKLHKDNHSIFSYKQLSVNILYSERIVIFCIFAS